MMLLTYLHVECLMWQTGYPRTAKIIRHRVRYSFGITPAVSLNLFVIADRESSRVELANAPCRPEK